MTQPNWKLSVALLGAAFCGGFMATCGEALVVAVDEPAQAIFNNNEGPFTGPTICRATRTDILISREQSAVESVFRYEGGLLVESQTFNRLTAEDEPAVSRRYFHDEQGRLIRVEVTDILISRDEPAIVDEYEYECEGNVPRTF